MDEPTSTYPAYAVREYEREGETKTAWRRVGTAFANRIGLTVLLDALPVNGRLVVITAAERPTEAEDWLPGTPD
jgi:hypothetical protein